MRTLDAGRTAQVAAYEADSRAATDLLLLSAAVASLAAVAFVLVRAGHSRDQDQSPWVALALVSVALSWTIVHTIYTLRCARLYYGGPRRGLQPAGPRAYAAFAYLALTVGRAYRVSDTPLRTSDLVARRCGPRSCPRPGDRSIGHHDQPDRESQRLGRRCGS
jgi:uncharacterized membrane protein